MRAPSLLSHLSLHPQPPPRYFFPLLLTATVPCCPGGKEHHCLAHCFTSGWGKVKEWAENKLVCPAFQGGLSPCSGELHKGKPEQKMKDLLLLYADTHQTATATCEKHWCHLAWGYVGFGGRSIPTYPANDSVFGESPGPDFSPLRSVQMIFRIHPQSSF